MLIPASGLISLPSGRGRLPTMVSAWWRRECSGPSSWAGSGRCWSRRGRRYHSETNRATGPTRLHKSADCSLRRPVWCLIGQMQLPMRDVQRTVTLLLSYTMTFYRMWVYAYRTFVRKTPKTLQRYEKNSKHRHLLYILSVLSFQILFLFEILHPNMSSSKWRYR